jgi:hypothetical protein
VCPFLFLWLYLLAIRAVISNPHLPPSFF